MSINYTSIKRINNRSIIVAQFGISDPCSNGYDEFKLNVTHFATNGDKTEGSHYLYENKLYYFVEGGYHCIELVTKYFPELLPIYPLKGCDIFGFNSYPILNGFYHLTQGNYNAVKNLLRIKDNEVKQLAENQLLYYTQFCVELQKTQYRREVEKAIKLIETMSGQEYKKTDKVSPRLYNDMYYEFISEEKGWNVYKTEKTKINNYPI